jgi:2'-5' RNA ligase
MELLTLYAGIAERGRACIEECGEQIDGWLQCPERDTRMGITLLIRIPGEMQGRILAMEQELLAVEPHQYYYPASDFHITVLDLLAATPGFVYTDALVESYDRVLARTLSLFGPFSISLCGILPSEGAILVKGYYEKALTQIRQMIRQALRDERLPLEERYETISSHVTIARFAARLQNRAALLHILSENAVRDFGEFQVCDLQLVYHNWFDSQKTVLANYRLG